MPAVAYYGPESPFTLHITAEPLTFVRGEPLEVTEGVWQALQALTDNAGHPVGWWSLYQPSSPSSEPETAATEDEAPAPLDDPSPPEAPAAPVVPKAKPANRAKAQKE